MAACNVRPVLAFWALQAFWLALALPGFALLWHWDRASLAGGSLAGLARCYLASLAVLTPVSVVGHVCQWPLWTLSGAYLAAVAAAIAVLVADPSWCTRPRWPGAVAAIGGTLLLLDLSMGARAGTHLEGDAGYHVARVRQLLELGLNNWDPLIADLRLEPVYHTNLYHALIASSAQLVGCDPVLAWLEVWPFAKLLCAACAYQLTYVLFGQRWLGWLAATALGVRLATYSVLAFPNTLAPVALLPFGLAAAIEVVCAAPSYRPVLWLAAATLALAQVHDLNSVFLGILAVPCIALALAYRWLRKRPGRRQLAAALLASTLSLPWLAVPALPRLRLLSAAYLPATAKHEAGGNHGQPQAPAADLLNVRKSSFKADQFIVLADGNWRLNPEELRGPEDRNLPGLYALVLALALGRRKQLRVFAALLALAGAWLLVPVLCSALVRSIGTAFAVTRLTGVFASASAILVPAAVCAVLPRRLLRSAKTRVPLELVALALAGLYGVRYGVRPEPWTASKYLDAARNMQSLVAAQSHAVTSARLSASIPKGATVMAITHWDYYLPMHQRCHTLALRPSSGGHGVVDMLERRAETEEFFARKTPPERCLAILRKRGIRQIYATPNSIRRLRVRLGDNVSGLASWDDGAVLSVEP